MADRIATPPDGGNQTILTDEHRALLDRAAGRLAALVDPPDSMMRGYVRGTILQTIEALDEVRGGRTVIAPDRPADDGALAPRRSSLPLARPPRPAEPGTVRAAYDPHRTPDGGER